MISIARPDSREEHCVAGRGGLRQGLLFGNSSSVRDECSLCTMRLKVIGNNIFKNVGKYGSCMVSISPIIF